MTKEFVTEEKVKERLREAFLDANQGFPDLEKLVDVYVELSWRALKDVYLDVDTSNIAHQPTNYSHELFHGRLFHAIEPRIRKSIAADIKRSSGFGMSISSTQTLIMLNYIAMLEFILPKDIREQIKDVGEIDYKEAQEYHFPKGGK
jgi:hypothetical protein